MLKKVNWLKVAEITLVTVFMIAPLFVDAQFRAPQAPQGVVTNSRTLPEFIQWVINILLGFSGLIALLFLILGGFWYITSAGNEETAEKGKNTVVNAVIGLVIIGLSWVIVNVVIDFLTRGGNTGV